MPQVDYSLLRSDVIESLQRYAVSHIETGGFLRAVLENNLSEACGRADEDNIKTLFHIVAYIYNELPLSCWGTPDRVERWLSMIPEKAGV